METMLDNREADRQRRARRAEKMAQMRREKEKREKLNRIMRMVLPLAAGVLGIIVIVMVGVTVFGKDSHKEQTQQAQIGEQGNQTTGQLDQAVAAPEQNGPNGQSNQISQLNPNEQNGQLNQTNQTNQQSGIGQTKVETPVYRFESTADTVNIYSDKVISTHAILINESTDTIVASKGARERISPASMTKVLTVLVAAEHITKEQLDDTFTMTLDITDYAYVNDCSSVGFLDGEKVPVRDLFYGTVLPSGGDAAVGLATYVAGSHEAFVEMMNEKLEELGLAESAHFTNCVGLYDKEHYCTVYDMAVIMKAAMENELCREFLSAHTYTTTPTTEHPEGITVSNWFLRRIEDKETGGEVIGAKTGYVVESKSCAVSYGKFADETPYICVTAGSDSSWKCIYDHVEIYNQYIPTEQN